jgi:hypothetical protein
MAPPAVMSHTSLPSQVADGVDHDTAVAVVLAHEGQQHGDAEVESLQEEESDPQHRDEDEPERGE